MSRDYFRGDTVSYVGTKYPELKAAVGHIDAQVAGHPGVYVVDFGSDAYTMPHHVLKPYVYVNKDGPQVLPIRRRKSEDEE